jgi:hypothetical protein
MQFQHVVLCYLAVMECMIGCLKVILNAGLVMDVKFVFPDTPELNAHGCFLCGYLKTKACASTVNTREEQRHQIQQPASEMKNTPRIFKHLCFIFTQGQNMCP